MENSGNRELVEAWRHATDADVARALGELADYPAAVQVLVQQEAERRGVTAGLPTAALELPGSFFLRGLGAISRFIWRHRFLAACISGFIIAAGLPWFAFRLMKLVRLTRLLATIFLIFEFAIVVGCILALSHPIRSYRRALRVTLGVALGAHIYNLPQLGPVWDAIRVLCRFPNPRRFPYPYQLVGWQLAPWLIYLSIVCAIIFVRNRYWPDYGPGRCTKCGYDLRGLPIPRCPECGTPFKFTEVQLPDAGAPSSQCEGGGQITHQARGASI